MRAFAFKNGDFIYNAAGFFNKVSGTEKVARDINKLLCTNQYSEGNATSYYRYNPGYGVRLNNKNLFKGLGEADIINRVNELLKEALEYFVNIQKNQTNIPIEELVQYFDYYSYYDTKNKNIVRVKITITMMGGASFSQDYFQDIA